MLVVWRRPTHLAHAFAFLLLFLLCGHAMGLTGQTPGHGRHRLERVVERRLSGVEDLFSPFSHLGMVSVDSFSVDRDQRHISLFMHPNITHIPLRVHLLRYFETEILNLLGRPFRTYSISLQARERPLYEFIPNYFRDDFLEKDVTRIRLREKGIPLLTHAGRQPFGSGLSGNHIALWHSHGMYYDAGLDRWQWQRARLFSTVEDILPMTYTLQYLVPMLELSGANVFLPRERDTQVHEVVVGLDGSTADSELIIVNGSHSWQVATPGFKKTDTLFGGDNPFMMGRSLHIEASDDTLSYIRYIPDIPADGYYAVYVSWQQTPEPVSDVRCRLRYAGGEHLIMLNQQMAPGTWVYLGTWFFISGKNVSSGSLDIYGHSAGKGIISAGAVRFGGGMGSVARRKDEVQTWKTSGHARYLEGARYYLQYAGMPDTLVYSLNRDRNDYNDDFQSRGEWVNYLSGAPLGPERDRNIKGLGIPIDLSLSIHTDAGITLNDSVIGTLAIYSAQRDHGLFPDGVSRLGSRDLADLVQDQLVSDIRRLHKPGWTRRALWDRQYSEAWRPNVPALLLEMFSHQNLADMEYGLDPRFQFNLSRAIYKGMLRFIAGNEGRDAVVAPLPPGKPGMEITGNKRVRICWEAVEDPLEPSAWPDGFMLYTREEGQGFDTGLFTETNAAEVVLPEYNRIYSFRVTGVNSGGESFPSETLSVALLENSTKPVLVVNAFDRISGPTFFDTSDYAGIAWWEDSGVPYRYNLSYTGRQYDFHRNSPWLDDDSPGWGASYADLETVIHGGNTFDFPQIYGQAILNHGCSFVSASRGAFESPGFSTEPYSAIIIIGGLQKGIRHPANRDSIDFRLFNPTMIKKLEEYMDAGGPVLLSGAYTGTDMVLHGDSLAMLFAKEKLGYTWRTNHATNAGQVVVTDRARALFPAALAFNTGYLPGVYPVEAPDAIEASGDNAFIIFRYAVGQTSAGVAYQGQRHKAVSLGFPFETITDPDDRNRLMTAILNFFEIKP